jgi:hypothetical protein
MYRLRISLNVSAFASVNPRSRKRRGRELADGYGLAPGRATFRDCRKVNNYAEKRQSNIGSAVPGDYSASPVQTRPQVQTSRIQCLPKLLLSHRRLGLSIAILRNNRQMT